jgi:hypothetical protein
LHGTRRQALPYHCVEEAGHTEEPVHVTGVGVHRIARGTGERKHPHGHMLLRSSQRWQHCSSHKPNGVVLCKHRVVLEVARNVKAELPFQPCSGLEADGEECAGSGQRHGPGSSGLGGKTDAHIHHAYHHVHSSTQELTYFLSKTRRDKIDGHGSVAHSMEPSHPLGMMLGNRCP